MLFVLFTPLFLGSAEIRTHAAEKRSVTSAPSQSPEMTKIQPWKVVSPTSVSVYLVKICLDL